MKKILLAILVLCFVSSSGLAQGQGAGPADVAERNWHVNVVLENLEMKNYILPEGDFIALALQPLGICSEVYVIDLFKGQLDIIPGTHDKARIVSRSLNNEEVVFYHGLVNKEGIRQLPVNNNKIGFDGFALVAIIKKDGHTQYIGHWQPESLETDILLKVIDYLQGKIDFPALSSITIEVK